MALKFGTAEFAVVKKNETILSEKLTCQMYCHHLNLIRYAYFRNSNAKIVLAT